MGLRLLDVTELLANCRVLAITDVLTEKVDAVCVCVLLVCDQNVGVCVCACVYLSNGPVGPGRASRSQSVSQSRIFR
jgi:hypothetical protein